MYLAWACVHELFPDICLAFSHCVFDMYTSPDSQRHVKTTNYHTNHLSSYRHGNNLTAHTVISGTGRGDVIQNRKWFKREKEMLVENSKPSENFEGLQQSFSFSLSWNLGLANDTDLLKLNLRSCLR